jgi:GxxExxY protein
LIFCFCKGQSRAEAERCGSFRIPVVLSFRKPQLQLPATALHGRNTASTPKGHVHTRLLHDALTDRIIRVFHQGHAELGGGHLESVYANAMAIALSDAGLGFAREVKIAVYFRGRAIGLFKADALVESVVMLEYKAGRALDPTWEEQLLNHLRNTRVELGLMLYFGRRPLVKRRILTNDQKLLPPLEPTGQS